MELNLIDLLLLIIAVLFAVSGYRQGFITAALSFVGFFGGAVLGAQLASPIARWLASGTAQVVLAVSVVLLVAFLGQILAVWVGTELRQRITWNPARAVDSVLGAGVSVLTVLLVSWLMALPLADAPFPRVVSAIRESQVITAVDNAIPEPVRHSYESLRELVDSDGFPDVFGTLAPTRVRPVSPPDPELLNRPELRTAQPSIVKVTGVARECSRRIEGSGFVYAREHVITNAHVVAGVQQPVVHADGERLRGRVVLYNPERDLAVIFVPDLNEDPLRFSPQPAEQGDSAVISGYPEDGPFFVGPARIREVETITGPDIYNRRTVTREVYTLRGSVRSGNSGGPLLTPDGLVYGVIFAAAVDDPETGFALTADEVEQDASRAATATAEVDTGDCD